MTGWPANPKLVRHLKSTLIWTGVHVDEAVMGLSVHTDEDGGGDNPQLQLYPPGGGALTGKSPAAPSAASLHLAWSAAKRNRIMLR